MQYTKLNLQIEVAPNITTHYDAYLGESSTKIAFAIFRDGEYEVKATVEKSRRRNITHKTVRTLIAAADNMCVWYIMRTLNQMFFAVSCYAQADLYPGVEDRVTARHRFVLDGKGISLIATENLGRPSVTAATQFGRIRAYPNVIVYENMRLAGKDRVASNVGTRRWQFRSEWAKTVHFKEAAKAAHLIEDQVYIPKLYRGDAMPSTHAQSLHVRWTDIGTLDGVVYRFGDHFFIPGYETLKSIGLFIYAALDVLQLQLEEPTIPRAGPQSLAIHRYMLNVARLTLHGSKFNKKHFLISPP